MLKAATINPFARPSYNVYVQLLWYQNLKFMILKSRMKAQVSLEAMIQSHDLMYYLGLKPTHHGHKAIVFVSFKHNFRIKLFWGIFMTVVYPTKLTKHESLTTSPTIFLSSGHSLHLSCYTLFLNQTTLHTSLLHYDDKRWVYHYHTHFTITNCNQNVSALRWIGRFGMRYGTERERADTELTEKAGKGKLWRTKEEEFIWHFNPINQKISFSIL